ncbi:hypothetical protein [Symbioplanes lichenis]|uniref:hypothetical protein n=1 Tax=Symbioplanes lichenis TaxID=1629072 RepID=UPI00273A4EBA|nr:hypothetical protein [Actinoplanes lichenis]
MRRFLVMATAAAALSLAACANGTGDEAGAPSAPSAAVPSATTPGATGPSEEPGVPSQEPSAPADEAGTTTLSGTIEAGVEPNCLILGKHLLVFKDPALQSAAKAGASVTVTGRVATGMMTTCMQGTPFEVTAIRPK